MEHHEPLSLNQSRKAQLVYMYTSILKLINNSLTSYNNNNNNYIIVNNNKSNNNTFYFTNQKY